MAITTNGTSAGTPIGILLWTVFESILGVFLLCLAGYILARRGIIDKKAQKQLNRINVSLFTPCLLFSKVAFNLTPEKLKELWIIPVFFILVTAVSTIAAFLLGWAFRLKRSQRNFAIAASMFMNSNSLPIALMQSLVFTVDGLKWGDDDDADSMVGRALSYLVVYSTLGMILRWSYGVHLLSQADAPEDDHPYGDETLTGAGAIRLPDEEAPLGVGHDGLNRVPSSPSAYSHTAVASNPSFLVTAEDDDGGENGLSHNHVVKGKKRQSTEGADSGHLKPHAMPRARHFFYSFPNTPTASVSSGPSSTSLSSASESYPTDAEGDEYDDLPHPQSHQPRTRPEPSPKPAPSLLRTRIRTIFHAVLEFMTAPLYAAIISLLVALVPPLQHLLTEHAGPVKGALTAAGDCSIPLTLVVLGAYFCGSKEENGIDKKARSGAKRTGRRTAETRKLSFLERVMKALRLRHSRRSSHVEQRPQQDQEETMATSTTTTARPGETRTVVIAVLSRMIITPALILPFMVLFTKFDLHKIFDDPVFVVSNVLLISAPPALTLAQMTQASGTGDAFERLLSRTIFWSYCVLTPPATIFFVMIGLLLSKL